MTTKHRHRADSTGGRSLPATWQGPLNRNAAIAGEREEAKRLVSKLQADGQIDEIERTLIENLVAKANKLPDAVRNLI